MGATTASRSLSVAISVFFLSGFAALTYQVVWQRLLIVFAGGDVHAVTLIVTAYMGGLGLGSLLGGRLADRLGVRRSLVAFALVELLIGAFALVSKNVYYDGLYAHLPPTLGLPALTAVLFASLLLPTLLMGMSLPLLARALTPSFASIGRVIGALYGWNTLGAAAGALVSTWLLLPRLGLQGSLWVGAGCNLLCAVCGAWLARQPAAPPTLVAGLPPMADAAPSGPVPANRREPSFASWVLLYGITGFLALSLEIVWFRMLGVMLKSTAFTFGTLLFVYLSGFGLGAALGGRLVRRAKDPGGLFLLLQAGAMAYAGAALVAVLLAAEFGWPARLVQYFGEYEPLSVYDMATSVTHLANLDFGAARPFFRMLGLYVLLPAVFIGPSTLMMGLSMPCLQRASHDSLETLGRRLGILLAVNILGSMLGAALTGWLLLPVLGTASTLRWLVVAGAAVATLALVRYRRRSLAGSRPAWVLAATAVLVAVALPDGAELWARLHGTARQSVLQREDGSGLSVLKQESGQQTSVFVNGIGQSWIPYGGIHTALGALPALLHPSPAQVLVIGLGSGDTVFAAGARPEVERLVCVEIIGAQLETLRALVQKTADPGVAALLSHPRLEHHEGDGRAFIRRSGQKFDVIEADALRPTSAFAGNLYSLEYFQLLAAHLAPGGLAVTWAPTERVRRTFLVAFPHVLAFGDVWVGSNSVIDFDAATIERRAAAVSDYFTRAGVSIRDVLRPLLGSPPRVYGPDHPRDRRDLNTDLHPRDEFALPQ
ncbi:MAG: fused MFS/spermidine synthase [Planctomycetes bacterium]|jgi:predicted membrane-bound spermidine synthase|nr:fused MFS/spermidine synthase [Planctomycetota bacterium]